MLKHKRTAPGAETRGNTGQLLVLKWRTYWTAPGAEIKQIFQIQQFISDFFPQSSLYPCKQTPEKQGSLVASQRRAAYNGSCLGNASLITLIGLISELAAGKCQSGQQKMEKLINGKGECLKRWCWGQAWRVLFLMGIARVGPLWNATLWQLRTWEQTPIRRNAYVLGWYPRKHVSRFQYSQARLTIVTMNAWRRLSLKRGTCDTRRSMCTCHSGFLRMAYALSAWKNRPIDRLRMQSWAYTQTRTHTHIQNHTNNEALVAAVLCLDQPIQQISMFCKRWCGIRNQILNPKPEEMKNTALGPAEAGFVVGSEETGGKRQGEREQPLPWRARDLGVGGWGVGVGGGRKER